MAGEDLQLITVIVQYKDESKVVDAMLKAGAPGLTYYYGRGTGVRQRIGWIGRLIQAEKVLIVSAVPTHLAKAVVEAATKAAKLDQPGNGFLVVQKAEYAIGLC